MTSGQDTSQQPASEVSAIFQADIGACLTLDEGACLMCFTCGHIFLAPIPLTDESATMPAHVLAPMLASHICGLRQPEAVARTTRHNTHKQRM